MGTGQGLPTRGRLEVAQINSLPTSSWANLETDQTRNSTAGRAEPGLMLNNPSLLPAPPEPQSQPEPNYPRSRHAPRLCGARRGHRVGEAGTPKA